MTVTVGAPPAAPVERKQTWKDYAVIIALGSIPTIVAGVAVHYLTKPKPQEQ